MRNANGVKHVLRRVLGASLAVTLLLTGCSAGGKINSEKIGTRETVSAAFTAQKYHFADQKNLVYVGKSGLISLYFDSETYAVAAQESNTGKTWYALPTASEGADTVDPAAVTLRISGEDKLYVLNSQDNSVAFETASFKPTENGIQVTYDMALDKETADCAFNDVPDGSLYASVTVSYTLADGALRAKINCGDILLSKGFTLESLTMLDFFGAVEKAGAEDYIFVPDGCGAVENIGEGLTGGYEHRTFVTYGEDLSLAITESEEQRVPARVPAYGIKSGDSAFLALIESGDAISEIHEFVSKGTGSYSRVGPTFRVTDAVCSGTAGKQTLRTGNTYTGDITVCYRFLADKNASYSGMAAACREMLIRNGVLSTKTLKQTEYLPFLLTVQNAAAKNNPNRTEVLTDYSQTLELLKLMKAKSMNNIYLRCNGILDGANNQGLLSESEPLKKLGSQKDFEALAQYVKTQQFNMYLNTDIVSFQSKSASPTRNAAKGLDGKSVRFTAENPFFGFAGRETQTRYLTKLSDLDGYVNDFIVNMQNWDFGGYCIDDAGQYLYSDYAGDTFSRTGAVNLLSVQAAALSAGHMLMVDTGNMYMLKNADAVADLPSETAYPQEKNYFAVPFLQMVLHGIVEYAHAPANTSENTETAVLRALEYGALPSYSWSFTKTDIAELDERFYYDNQITKAAEQYAVANELLSDLRGARMTAHEKVQDGVYKAEYNNSILLYCNYNDTPVTVNSVTIEPMHCLRVN